MQRNTCTIFGAGATVGIFHSAGYLYWRSLLAELGLTPNGVFQLLLVLDAVAVALVALAARTLDGPVSAGLAAILMLAMIGVPMQNDVISDVAPIPFLGAAFLLVAVETVARPSFLLAAALGLLGGVMANFYSTCLLCGVSGVWICLLVPRRRWALAAVMGGCFGLATFAIAPFGWLEDLQVISRGIPSNGNLGTPNPLFGIPVARLTGLGVLCAALGAAFPKLRHRVAVPVAIVLPLFVPLLVFSHSGRLMPQDKYCAHVLGALAALLPLPAVAALRAVSSYVRKLSARWAQRASRSVVTWLVSLPASLGGGVATEKLILYGSAAVIAFGPGTGSATPYIRADPTMMNMDDLTGAERFLAQRGWGWQRAARDLKMSGDTARRAALNVDGWPDGDEGNDLERAYLMKLPLPGLGPGDLPPRATVVSSTGSAMTVLVLTCSWIDWRSFDVCLPAPDGEQCTHTGIPPARLAYLDDIIPGMPLADQREGAWKTMRLRFPLRPSPQCPEEWIYMPAVFQGMAGRIVRVDGAISSIDGAGRLAKLKIAPDASHQPELTLEFDPKDSSGLGSEYRGYPPYFLEGDPESVAFMKIALAGDEFQ